MEEREKEFVVRAEVPGFEANELVVNLTGNMLTIRAEHKVAREGKEEVERRFERTFTVPTGVIPEKIEALYRNGVLEVHLPRSPEPEGRRIEVKV
jgi:HSP20 family protein